MSHQFSKKGINKQTWEFRKKHPAVRRHVTEARARIAFFEQIEAIEKKTTQELSNLKITGHDRTPPPAVTRDPVVKKLKRTGQIVLTMTSKVDQKNFNRLNLQKIMDCYDQDPHTTEERLPDEQLMMSLLEYLQAVRHGKVPKDPNHEHIVALSKLPDHRETKICVMKYHCEKAAQEAAQRFKAKQPKST